MGAAVAVHTPVAQTAALAVHHHHTPARRSPMALAAPPTPRSTLTRSSPTATSTRSPTPRQTTTSTPSSPTTAPVFEPDPTQCPCLIAGSSSSPTPRTPTATSPRSPTRAPPSSQTLSELFLFLERVLLLRKRPSL